MDWDAVQLEGKSKGYLVFAMDQAQTPLAKNALTKSTFEGGYCLGLCGSWCAHMYRGENFPIAGDVCDSPPLKAGLVQWLAGKIDNKDWTSAWTQAVTFDFMGISDNLRATRAHKPTASFLHAMATKAYGCYGVTISGTWGTHAIALRHGKDNRMHLFDPNYGHFAVRDHTKLKSMLRWFLAATTYDQNFESFVGVLGIRPAINWTEVMNQ